jgi:ribonuclease HI
MAIVDHQFQGSQAVTVVPVHLPDTFSAPLPNSRPVGGRLKGFLEAWKQITDDPWVLQVISKGLPLHFKGKLPPLSAVPKPVVLPKNQAKREALLEAVQSLESKAAVVRCQKMEPAFFAHLFVVPKKDGGWRPVIDLNVLNRFLAVPTFKMETVQTIRSQLQQGEYVVVLDLQDAYFHLSIMQNFQKFLKFCIMGIVYKFIALCFGLATAPRAFTKVMRAVVKYVRKLGMLLHAYLDDWLLRNRSPEILMQQLKKLLDLLEKLGILVNFKKSKLTPMQIFVFLGVKFDLTRALVFPTVESLRKLNTWIEFLKGEQVVPARALLSFLGLLNHLADLVPLGRLNIRPIQWYLKCFYKPHVDNLYKKVPLKKEFFLCLPFWENQKNLLVGSPLRLKNAQMSIFTDASQAGWGAQMNNKSSAGQWILSEAEQHSNVRELMAMIEGLKTFSQSVKNKVVMMVSDNITAVAHVQKQGGTHSWILYKKSVALFQLADSLQVTLRARWMPGKDLIEVDSLSRINQVMEAEWSLQEVVCRRLFSLFPEVKIDMFATFANKRLPVFISPCPDTRAMAIDAFSISWEGLMAYAFPPIRLIAPVLQKIQLDKCCILLIAPAWPGQAWFPTILSLLVEFPRRLPTHRKLLSQKAGRMYHSNPQDLSLHAWPLSRDPTRRRDFLRVCQKERPWLIENLQGPSMTLAFQNSPNGASLAKDLWER